MRVRPKKPGFFEKPGFCAGCSVARVRSLVEAGGTFSVGVELLAVGGRRVALTAQVTFRAAWILPHVGTLRIVGGGAQAQASQGVVQSLSGSLVLARRPFQIRPAPHEILQVFLVQPSFFSSSSSGLLCWSFRYSNTMSVAFRA